MEEDLRQNGGIGLQTRDFINCRNSCDQLQQFSRGSKRDMEPEGVPPMANKFQQLKPGDLITADFVNSILDALNSLEARLAAAESQLGKAKAKLVPLRPNARSRRLAMKPKSKARAAG
jgi:hypothetical protein